MVITTNDITMDKITTKGTLPRRSINLKLGYLKLDTIKRPAEIVKNAAILDSHIDGSKDCADHTKPAIRAAAAGLGSPVKNLVLLIPDCTLKRANLSAAQEA